MRINSNRELRLLYVTLSFTVLSTILVLNFNIAFSQNEDVSYLDVNGTNSVQLSKFSVAAWFKTSTDYNSNAFIVNKAGASDNMNYGIWMTNSETIRGGFETSSGSAFYATSPLSYSDGNWHYAVVTFDGSAIGLYIDGLPVATKTASASPDSGGEEPIRMGADSQTLTNYFIGNVDEVRIWNNALTPQQVIDAYNGNFNPQNLVEYLDFSEPIIPVNATTPVNATVTNQTGIPDNNGTLNNGTGPITTPVSDNGTSITNDTGGIIPPVEIPPISNNTGFSNDTGTGDQQAPPGQVNNPPRASGQSISVDQDKQVDITLEATDKDNDQLQFDITADPSQGSLTDFDNAKGTVTYVPKEGYFGDDKFSFKVTDDKGSESNAADVNVNVNEVTPPPQNQQNEENNVVENTNTENTTQAEENTNTNTNAQALEQPNQPPKADAGDDQKAEVNTEVKLDAGDSSDQDGEIVSYKWEQTDGPEVDLKDSDKQVAVFDVPESAADSNLVFKLTVSDDKSDTAEDDVTIEVEQIQQDESNSEGESN
jgi:Concanavalin A-like lectin/glucanases superfamily/Bacterial Ig domain/PKD domain